MCVRRTLVGEGLLGVRGGGRGGPFCSRGSRGSKKDPRPSILSVSASAKQVTLGDSVCPLW